MLPRILHSEEESHWAPRSPVRCKRRISLELPKLPHKRVWNRVYILRVRSEIEYGFSGPGGTLPPKNVTQYPPTPVIKKHEIPQSPQDPWQNSRLSVGPGR